MARTIKASSIPNVGKSERKSAPGRPFVSGDPRAGRGPKKGAPNAGRPRNEHVAWCQSLVSDPRSEEAVKAVLGDKNHPAFATMWKAVADRAYGKAPQSVEITGADGQPLPPAVIQVALVRP